MRWMKEIITSRDIILFHTPRPKLPHEKFIILEKYKNYFTFGIGYGVIWSIPELCAGVRSTIILELSI